MSALGRPSKLLEFFVVQEVPLIIEGPVVNKLDGFLSFQVENLAYIFGHIHDRPLLICSDVVDVPDFSAVKNDLKCLGDILTVEVAPDIGPSPWIGRGSPLTAKRMNFGMSFSGNSLGP
uniref:Uncharacterized protein n=2 Tax=Setaria italica TaxID=4555 RepID=K3YWU1_SETIT